jgi:hypothetical protein
MTAIQPDSKWCADISAAKGVPGRCPFASVHRCPRYYASTSLLGANGAATPIDAQEDQRLLERWKRSDLWPVTAENETRVSGQPGKPSMLVRIRSRLPCGRNRPRQRPSKPCKGRGDRTRLALDFQRCSALALHGVSALLAANARRQRDEGQAPNWIQRAELRVVRAQSPCDAKTVSVPSTLAHRQPKIAIYLNSPSRGGFPAGSWLPQQ